MNQNPNNLLLQNVMFIRQVVSATFLIVVPKCTHEGEGTERRRRKRIQKKNNICIEIQSVLAFTSLFFRDPIVFEFLFCCFEFIERTLRLSQMKKKRTKRYKLAQINVVLSSIIADLTKPTQKWRKMWTQRPKLPSLTQGMLQHCQSSSKLRRQKTWRRRRRRTTNQQPSSRMMQSPQNQDFASCFRFYSFSLHSQRC